MSSESKIKARSSGSSGEHEKTAQNNANEPGQLLFDRYSIDELVGDNGAIVQYKGLDLGTNHPILVVTVKSKDPASIESFKKVVRDYLALDHENIFKPLAVHESETGQPYLIKDLNNLIKLEELISSTGPMAHDIELAELLLQICCGVSYAHEHGIPHGALSPDRILLGEVNGKVLVKIDGFEENNVSVVSGNAGLLQQATVQADILRLALIAYFLATNELPGEMLSCDEMCDQLSLFKSYESLADCRSDLGSVDEFIQLLEDASNTDVNLQIKSVKEFEDGLMDWMEAARATRKSEISQSLSTDETIDEGDRKTKDLSSAVRHMILLRHKQNEQELSMVMKISEFADGKGPRRAPAESIGKLVAKGVIACSALSLVCIVSIRWHDELNEAFVSASQKLIDGFSRHGPEDEIPFDDDESPLTGTKAGKRSGKKQKKNGLLAPLRETNDQRNRKNRVPPFNPALLRDIYREGTISSANNLGRRHRFRIEYRRFNEEWLK